MSDYTLEPIRRTPWRLWLCFFLALGAAGAAGYFAWEYRMLSREQLSAATACSERLSTLRQDHDVLARSAETCETARRQLVSTSQTSGAALAQVETNLGATRLELEQLRAWKAEASKRMETVRGVSQKLQKMVDTGKLGVQVRDGRLVVRLSEDVLFPSGQASLSRDGELALMEVAVVLKQFPDRRFMVAGHTDDQPIKPGQPHKDNWDLSLARASAVTRFLIEAKVKPQNVVAAGYGQFDPIATNKTPKGRAENRRIEIVLLPDLSELPALPADIDATVQQQHQAQPQQSPQQPQQPAPAP